MLSFISPWLRMLGSQSDALARLHSQLALPVRHEGVKDRGQVVIPRPLGPGPVLLVVCVLDVCTFITLLQNGTFDLYLKRHKRTKQLPYDEGGGKDQAKVHDDGPPHRLFYIML